MQSLPKFSTRVELSHVETHMVSDLMLKKKQIFQRVELGDLARDRVSLYEGIVTQRTDYLQGCTRFCIQPQGLTADGKIKDILCFDEPQIEVVEKGFYKLNPEVIEITTTGSYCGIESVKSNRPV